MRKYTVIYERGTRNWSAFAPDLPGCIATGKTRRQVERRMREAIEFHIEAMIEQGEPVPKATTVAGVVSISA